MDEQPLQDIVSISQMHPPHSGLMHVSIHPFQLLASPCRNEETTKALMVRCSTVPLHLLERSLVKARGTFVSSTL
jgi:hypothetical protein